ncbi:hypothetical protein [Intrasporangium calvum]|uniref:hypothetical protein n=1 Tax=Intrasporangium calvum TaxID=53358 RepID=UPI001F15A334|nr:hypothetical protein [Intrasporangium calvum]
MPIPHFVTGLNKRYTNRALVHLAGRGPFVELEHVGGVARGPSTASRSSLFGTGSGSPSR